MDNEAGSVITAGIWKGNYWNNLKNSGDGSTTNSRYSYESHLKYNKHLCLQNHMLHQRKFHISKLTKEAATFNSFWFVKRSPIKLKQLVTIKGKQVLEEDGTEERWQLWGVSLHSVLRSLWFSNSWHSLGWCLESWSLRQQSPVLKPQHLGLRFQVKTERENGCF